MLPCSLPTASTFVDPGCFKNSTAVCESYWAGGTHRKRRLHSMPYAFIVKFSWGTTLSQNCGLSSQKLRWWLWLTTRQLSLDMQFQTHCARAMFNKVVRSSGLSRWHCHHYIHHHYLHHHHHLHHFNHFHHQHHQRHQQHNNHHHHNHHNHHHL